jgi:hypothetical protein
MAKCKSCGAEIYWEKTANGKLCPYDFLTKESHFKTCPQATKWSKKNNKGGVNHG